MAYSAEDKERLFNEVCNTISDGFSLRSVLRKDGMPSRSEFYSWIDEDESGIKKNHYARACEMRADTLFDEILEIADDSSNDTFTVEINEGVESEKVDHENIQRSRLKVDARKWALSKMLPKKYGEKLDVTTDGDRINTITIFKLPDDGRNP